MQPGPGAYDGEPAIGSEQFRIQIAIRQLPKIPARRDELRLNAEFLLRKAAQCLRHRGAGDIANKYPACLARRAK